MIFTAPPWDDLGVLVEARPEMGRVLSRKGLWVLLMPGADKDTATLGVMNRDWTQRQSFTVERPNRRVGRRYFSPTEEFVRKVLARYNPRRLLDPFCGSGTIPRVAQTMGIFAVGSDIA